MVNWNKLEINYCLHCSETGFHCFDSHLPEKNYNIVSHYVVKYDHWKMS